MAGGDKARKFVQRWTAEHQMIPEQLDGEAEIVRTLYETQRQTLYPQYRGVSSSRYPMTFWRQVVIAIKDANASPDLYIKLAFNLFKTATYPERLLSDVVARAYNSDEIIARETPAIERDAYMYAEKLNQRWHEGRKTLPELLMDPDICGALFAWCMARKHGLTDAAARLKQAADVVLESPAYRDVYKRLFPEVFNAN